MNNIKNVFLNLIRGEYGLGTTFWGWFVVGSFLLTSIFISIASDISHGGILVPLVFIWLVYHTVVFIGVWKADKSSSFPSIASKILIVVSFLIITIIMLYLIMMMSATYPNH